MIATSPYDETIDWYDKAIEIDPKNTFALTGKGYFLRGIGKLDELWNAITRP